MRGRDDPTLQAAAGDTRESKTGKLDTARRCCGSRGSDQAECPPHPGAPCKRFLVRNHRVTSAAYPLRSHTASCGSCLVRATVGMVGELMVKEEWGRISPIDRTGATPGHRTDWLRY